MLYAGCEFKGCLNQFATREVWLQDSGNLLLGGQVETGSVGAFFHAPTWEARSLVVFSIQRHGRQGVEVLAIDHRRFNNVFTEPDHATTTDGCECGITKMFNLEHYTDIRWEVKAFTIRECEELCVIE